MTAPVLKTAVKRKVGDGTPGPGRPKGKPNKTTKALKEMILGALADAGGQAYLVKQAQLNPAAFMTLLGKVLPMQIKADVAHSVFAREPVKKLESQAWAEKHIPPALQ